MFQWLSLQTGIGENVIRLLFSILLGYPIAYVYRHRFLATLPGLSLEDSTHVRNNYIAFTGISIALLFNGTDIIHSLITVLATYSICLIIGSWLNNRFLSAGLVLIFNIGYLGYGYIVNSNDDYDLTWTMPQCVLCLRMIGFGMDFYDGAKKKEKPELKRAPERPASANEPSPKDKANSNTNKPKPKTTISFTGDTSLIELPKILHFFGYSYFFSSFLVGPQFSFTLYSKFISGKNFITKENREGKIPSGASEAATRCFLLGVLYLILQQVMNHFFPPSLLFTATYDNYSFIQKLMTIWFTGKGIVTKYLGIWILNEGACILSGISFNGYDSQGKAEWDGLSNIDLFMFETATSLDDVIAGFNINTNFWVKQYVFKRLRFLNSKYLSQLGSLFFLALWHGFKSGYFMCFTLEFIDMAIEKSFKIKISSYTRPYYESSSPLRHLITLFSYLYTTSALHYALISFGLLNYSKYSAVYSSVYWIGHWLLPVILIVTTLLPRGKPLDVAKKQK